MFGRKRSVAGDSRKFLISMVILFILVNGVALARLAYDHYVLRTTELSDMADQFISHLTHVNEELDRYLLLVEHYPSNQSEAFFRSYFSDYSTIRVTVTTETSMKQYINDQRAPAPTLPLSYHHTKDGVEYAFTLDLHDMLPAERASDVQMSHSWMDEASDDSERNLVSVSRTIEWNGIPHSFHLTIENEDLFHSFLALNYFKVLLNIGLGLLVFIGLRISFHTYFNRPFDRLERAFKHYSELSIDKALKEREAEHGHDEANTILNYFERFCMNNQLSHQNEIKGLQQQLDNAKASNQSKSLYLANMSHEMRTPLNSVIGYAQLIDKVGYDDVDKVKRFVERIHLSSDILLQKINDILDLAKIEANQFEFVVEPQRIRQLVKEVHDLLSVSANRKGIRFNYFIDPQIPNYLLIDATRFKQVLINLCSNAIKFTSEGEVNLEIDLFGHINRSVVLDYKVRDTGIGIDANEIDQIFIPFIQVGYTDRANQGTGLGLTITRDLIRLMGGEISVTSKVGVGTIFSFTTIFEIGENAEEVLVNTEPTDEEIQAMIQDLDILVVEDNMINQMLIKEIFSVFGKKHIEIAEDGLEAIEKCKAKVYDIVFMDIQMPRCNGVEATVQIKQLSPYRDIPIIALTANAFTNQVNEYLSKGMADYLKKPLDITELKKVINQQIIHRIRREEAIHD